MPVVSEKPISISIEELAYSKLLCYAAMQNPSYKIGKMHEKIADYLEAVERGEIKRLMIFAPPRSGKTMMVSEFFPAWFMGRNPDKHIISCSYSQTRANDVGRKVRNQLDDKLHRSIFPDCQIADDMKSIQHFSTYQNGEFYSMGVGGSIVGRGAHCCDGNTVLNTEYGNMKLSEIVRLYCSCNREIKVLSLDVGLERLEYNKILAFQENVNDTIYTITTNTGHRVRTTGDHRFFVQGRGYVSAEDLSTGDRLIVKKEQAMPDLQTASIKKQNALQSMLFSSQVCGYKNNMRFLREGIIKKSRGYKKIYKKRIHCSLLFPHVFCKSSCSQKHTNSAMSNLRNDLEKSKKILFQRMYVAGQSCHQAYSKLWLLRERICSDCKKPEILLKGLCRNGSSVPVKWNKRYKLRTANKIRDTFQINERCYFGKRFRNVLRLLDTCKNYPSHQFEQRRQQAGKFNNHVPAMPHETSQIQEAFVTGITVNNRGKERVYDIQVERTGNFFADEILVSNCFLIDDPCKDRASAESVLERKKMQTWYRGVAYTRLMVGGKIIIISTRWHGDDLAGWLLKEHASENWVVLNMPAIAEENDVLGREPGEALWPEAYPLETLQTIRTAIGSYEWNAQYQQRPVSAEGSIVKHEWLRKYDTSKDLPQFQKIVLSCDTAFKATELADPTAILVWGVTKNEYYLLDVLCRRMEFHELKRSITMMYQKWSASACLVEDRSSGQSLIQEFKRISPIPVIPIKTMNIDKVTRFSSVSHYFESGAVLLPMAAPWLVDYETQITSFPYDKHDDMVDATSQFLIWCAKPRYSFSLKPLFWK